MKIDMKDFKDFILDDKNILELFKMFKSTDIESWIDYNTFYPHRFYNKIVELRDSSKVVNVVDGKEKFDFDLLCFNKWKNYIIKSDSNKVNRKFRDGFIKYRYLLENINPKSVSEIENLTNGDNFKDQNIRNFLNAFSFYNHKSSMFSNWTNISSYILTLPRKKEEWYDVKGRFYLNIDSNYIHRFAKEFMKKCEEQNIPYIFKYDERAKREDSMVFYTNYELIDKHLEILKQIRNENNNIKNSIHKPPLLSAKLDNWLGYGAEPVEKIDIEAYDKIYRYPKSFNSLRSLLIYGSFMQIGKRIIKKECDKDKKYKEYLLKIISKKASDSNLFNKYEDAKYYYTNNFDDFLNEVEFLCLKKSLDRSNERIFAEIIKEHMCYFLENDKDLIDKFRNKFKTISMERKISALNSAFNTEDEKVFDMCNSDNKSIKVENYSSIIDTMNNYAISESGEFVDKKTRTIVKDEKLKYKIIFSKCWQNVVEANGYLSVDPVNGNIVANNKSSKPNSMVYNPEVKKIYDVFMASCICQIKENGYIEPIEVLACVDSFDINCYLKDDLVISLFSRYDTARVIDTYARSFVPNSKSNSNMYKIIEKYGTELEDYFFKIKK